MTVLEKIKACVDNFDCETDNVDKLIALAYYIGKEKATKDISDQYNALLREQRERANACRYKHLAHSVIGDKQFIYSPDYAGDMTEAFGSDETNI